MEKNNQKDQKRIELAVKLLIDTEIEMYKRDGHQLGLVRKYFRFVHLGNRLVHKISAAGNATFILKSIYEDLEIKIVKGEGREKFTVSIERNELCWQKN